MTSIGSWGPAANRPIQAFPWQLLASTDIAGVALVNGTPNILQWTAPNDGQMHRVNIVGNLNVTVTETGGQLRVAMTDPGGNVHNFQVAAGGSGVGGVQLTAASLAVQGGTTVTLQQSTALTGGAAQLWAEMWGS